MIATEYEVRPIFAQLLSDESPDPDATDLDLDDDKDEDEDDDLEAGDAAADETEK